MNKTVKDAKTAVSAIKDGSVIMLGGFGLCGIPENLIKALKDHGAKDLTLISNNAGTDAYGIGTLIKNGQVKKMIMSYGGECKAFEDGALADTIQVEWNPQGSLAERIRAAGAGLGGFYTPTGFGTLIAEGKETREFDGKNFVFERPLHADFALVRAWKGDTFGNLQFHRTARNFNQIMATAGKTVIAEVEELLEPGKIHPDSVHTPGIYVDQIFKGAVYERPIEKLTVQKLAAKA